MALLPTSALLAPPSQPQLPRRSMAISSGAPAASSARRFSSYSASNRCSCSPSLPSPSHSRSVRCQALGEGSRRSFDETVYQGTYGPWKVEQEDVREVILYRCGLVTTAASFLLAASTAFLPEGNTFVDIIKQDIDFLFAVGAGGLGLSLLLIHIYVTPIKRFLQLLWITGVFGSIGTYLYLAQPLNESLIQYIINNPVTIWFVGPLFAALTGVVFKEARKFQQPIKDDIGDKSVFMFNALPEEEKMALLQKLEEGSDPKQD